MGRFLNTAHMLSGFQGSAADVTAPTITSSASVSVAENSVLAHSLTANEPVSWSIRTSVQDGTSVDYTHVQLSGSTVQWVSNGTKDFEAPGDTGSNNTYIFVVRATDLAGNTTDQTITVTVTDVSEGSELFPDPDLLNTDTANWAFDTGMTSGVSSNIVVASSVLDAGGAYLRTTADAGGSDGDALDSSWANSATHSVTLTIINFTVAGEVYVGVKGGADETFVITGNGTVSHNVTAATGDANGVIHIYGDGGCSCIIDKINVT